MAYQWKTKIIQVLAQLAKTGKKEEQLEILRQLNKDKLGKIILQRALDPYVTYGVKPKSVAPIKTPAEADDMLGWEWEWMGPLLTDLAHRTLTGNKAKEAILKHGKVQCLLDRILCKDLRVGVHAKTINKVFPGLIPMFEVALADEGFVVIDGVIVQRAKVEYPIWGEPKYDGVRVASMRGKRDVAELLSRKGKQFDNFRSIQAAVQMILGEYDYMLDGEVVGATFKEVMQVAQRKDGTLNDDRLTYRVWDGMPRVHFLQQIQEQSLLERQQCLAEIIKGNPKIERAPGVMINSEEEMLHWFLEMRRLGLEGLILKPLHLPYSFKRDRSWIKVKEMFTSDFQLTAFIEGSGKYAGTLGAIEITTADGVEVDIGSGFKDAERVDIWKHKKKYLGKWIEIKYQEKTDDGSLRFPVVNRDEGDNIKWRVDRDMDDKE